MNYKDKVFPLEVILDASYWKQLKTSTKYPVSLHFKPGTVQPFLSTSTGVQISGLTWTNAIDSVIPYHSGYSNVLWNVSDLKQRMLVNSLCLYCLLCSILTRISRWMRIYRGISSKWSGVAFVRARMDVRTPKSVPATGKTENWSIPPTWSKFAPKQANSSSHSKEQLTVSTKSFALASATRTALATRTPVWTIWWSRKILSTTNCKCRGLKRAQLLCGVWLRWRTFPRVLS